MKKILIVDDDPDILEAVKMILDSEGFDSATTSKGDETYEKIGVFKPDVIILDVLLSGNDGRTICKKVKENPDTKDIPIIMISAHPSAHKSIELCGADAFVSKPFSIQDLLTQINHFISPNTIENN